jgi:hypothetical protein
MKLRKQVHFFLGKDNDTGYLYLKRSASIFF